MLAKGALQLVHADVLLRHMSRDDLAIVNQKAGLALDQFSEAPISTREVGHYVVEQQDSQGGCHSANKRVVRAGHCVLNGVSDQQKQGEVEGGHLSNLAFATQ